MMHEVLLTMALAANTPVETVGPDTTEAVADEVSKSPSALRDQAVVYGATALYAAAYADVRNRIIERGNWANIADNFRDPIGRAIEGARNDRDPFETNYIAHPVSWGLVGYYFRSRGHSFWSSLAMSQGHSIVWEYVVEGSYAKPSGKDLITNFAGATLGIALAAWMEGSPVPVTVEAESEPVAAAAFPSAWPGPGGAGMRLTVSLQLAP